MEKLSEKIEVRITPSMKRTMREAAKRLHLRSSDVVRMSLAKLVHETIGNDQSYADIK